MRNPFAAPAGFTASAGVGKVVLDWTDPSNSSINGYEYQQREPSKQELDEVSWQAPSSSVVSTITAWQYRFKTGGGTYGSWTNLCLQSNDTTCKDRTGHRIQDSSLVSGSHYHVQVRHLVGQTSTTVKMKVGAAPVTTDGSGNVTANWLAVSGATSYQYRTKLVRTPAQVRLLGEALWSEWADAGTGTTKNITGLTASTAYQVQVRALKPNEGAGAGRSAGGHG